MAINYGKKIVFTIFEAPSLVPLLQCGGYEPVPETFPMRVKHEGIEYLVEDSAGEWCLYPICRTSTPSSHTLSVDFDNYIAIQKPNTGKLTPRQ